MAPLARQAEITTAAADVDFPYHPTTHPGGLLGLFNYADELVPQDPTKPGIAPQYLQIGVADAS
jgi:hypothetical protein